MNSTGLRGIAALLLTAGLLIQAVGAQEAYPAYPPLSPYGAMRFEEANLAIEAALALSAIGEPAVPALVELLQGAEPEGRRYAAISLGYMGPSSAPHLPELTEIYFNYPRTDYMLAAALGRVGAAAVPSLVAELAGAGERPERALLALALAGPDAAGAVDALAAVLATGDPVLKVAAADALATLGPAAAPALPTLIAALDDADEDVRSRAAFALGELQLAPELVIPALTEVLGRDLTGSAYWYAGALGEYGAAAAAALPVCGSIFLDSPEKNVLAYPLARLGAEAIPWFIQALQSQDPQARYYGAYGLGVVAQDAQGAVDALLVAMSDPDSAVRWCAAQSLGFIGAQPERVVPALAAALDSPDVAVHYCAAYALGFFGPAAAPASDSLLAALGNADRQVQLAALISLGQIGAGNPRAIELIRPWLSSDDQSEPGPAAVALIRMGVEPEQVARELLAAVASEEANWTLCQQLYEAGPPALPLLTVLLRDGDAVQRMCAGATLGMFGAAATSAQPALAAALTQDNPPAVQVALALALTQVTGDPTATQRAIPPALATREYEATLYALFAAEQIGPAAQPVVVEVAGQLASTDWELGLMAMSAIQAMGPAAAVAVPSVIDVLSRYELSSGED